MSNPVGYEMKLYRGAAADSGQPATLMTNVTDVKRNQTRDEADTTTRANNGYKARKPTLKDLTIEFEMLYDTEDADYAALQGAYDANTPLRFACVDPDGNGIAANMEIMDFSVDEPLKEGVKVSVKLAVATAGHVEQLS